MGDTTTLSVKRETLERFNDRKAETGNEDVPELNADQFLKSLLDTWDENGQSIYGGGIGDLRPYGGKVPEQWDTDALEAMLERTDDAEYVPLYESGDDEPVDYAKTVRGAMDADEIAEAVVDALDLDADGPNFDALAREVAARIDYAELSKQVADELEARR